MAWHSMPVTKDGKADEIVVLYCTVEDNVDSNCMDLPIEAKPDRALCDSS